MKKRREVKNEKEGQKIINDEDQQSNAVDVTKIKLQAVVVVVVVVWHSTHPVSVCDCPPTTQPCIHCHFIGRLTPWHSASLFCIQSINHT